jgi:hypothetical protein
MPDGRTKQEKYVTELAGPEDRWVTVTDASRIARRQEHTIRSWIACGALPVHPERIGINKKTRQIRLSDLTKLTPIIDPDAAIATDFKALNLFSIPRTQQQLVEQMAALQQEVAKQQGRAEAAEQEVRQLRRDLDAQKRFQQALQKQLDEEREAREELARQVSKLLQPSNFPAQNRTP